MKNEQWETWLLGVIAELTEQTEKTHTLVENEKISLPDQNNLMLAPLISQ